MRIFLIAAAFIASSNSITVQAELPTIPDSINPATWVRYTINTIKQPHSVESSIVAALLIFSLWRYDFTEIPPFLDPILAIKKGFGFSK